MTRLVAIALTLFVLGCGAAGSETAAPAPAETTSTPVVAALGEVITLRQEQSAQIPSESLTLVFRAVGIDSRCPTDVNCVWEGNAEVRLEVVKAGQPPAQLELNTSSCAPCLEKPAGTEPRRGSYLEYEVELRSLGPERRSDAPIALRDYVVQLVVSRR